jgi:hypothetical protein
MQPTGIIERMRLCESEEEVKNLLVEAHGYKMMSDKTKRHLVNWARRMNQSFKDEK